MMPTEARSEILRINATIFHSLLEAFATVLKDGGSSGAINAMGKSAEAASEAVNASFRSGVRAFSLGLRRELPKSIVYRGTTLRWLRGDPHQVQGRYCRLGRK